MKIFLFIYIFISSCIHFRIYFMCIFFVFIWCIAITFDLCIGSQKIHAKCSEVTENGDREVRCRYFKIHIKGIVIDLLYTPDGIGREIRYPVKTERQDIDQTAQWKDNQTKNQTGKQYTYISFSDWATTLTHCERPNLRIENQSRSG